MKTIKGLTINSMLTKFNRKKIEFGKLQDKNHLDKMEYEKEVVRIVVIILWSI